MSVPVGVLTFALVAGQPAARAETRAGVAATPPARVAAAGRFAGAPLRLPAKGVSSRPAGSPVAPRPLVIPPSIGSREPPPNWPLPPPMSASSYVVVDAATGQTLAAKDADIRRSVASTVKILTALSVLRRASLDDVVTAGEEVRGLAPDAAKVGLEPGEVWTVGDLLEALIARSGNDAALALAAGIGGTVAEFVGLMQADAAELGLDGLALYEPAGLGDHNRLSARDLADITRAALADARFVGLVTQRAVDLPGVGPVSSRNRLLREYPGALGVKTGFTGVAGRCLVAAAERDGRRFLAVVLGSTLPEGHFTDARNLLDFAFTNFARVPVAGQEPELELRVPGEWVSLDGPPTSLFAPASEPALDRTVQLPVEAGPGLGTVMAVQWHEVEVGRLQLSGGWSPGSAAGGASAVGSWLMGRAYAAMRAATATHLWAVAYPQEELPPVSPKAGSVPPAHASGAARGGGPAPRVPASYVKPGSQVAQ
ncbi:MAG: D-alanyl-D-alanine carboxypeptidase family protein [Nitriliruptorales bacterium]